MRSVKYILGLLLLVGFVACKKDKTDFRYEEQPGLPPLTASTVRIMNFAWGAPELLINGDTLTSHTPPNVEGYYLIDNTRPSLYFSNGRLGATYAIPQRFINQDGSAHVALGIMVNGSPQIGVVKAFDVKEDVVHPTDYYDVTYGPLVGDQTFADSVFPIQRSISPPSNPQNFKIRVVNLSSTPGRGMEGNMTLVYANGTPVDAKTTSVAPGATSDYIEVPYGTYQFKLVTDNGKVIPGVPVNSTEPSVISPTQATMELGGNPSVPSIDAGITYAASKTYQPGGVYTIAAAASNAFSYYPPGSTFSGKITMNSFRIVADVTEPLNITYGKVQAVNALPGATISVTVDDAPLQSDPVAFTKSSAYKTLITGTHKVTVKDASGAVIGEQSFSIYGSDNYSAWVFPDASGKPVLKIVTNNLSGTYSYNVNNSGDDGANSLYSMGMPCWVRFLNLSTDIPEVSFTDGNGAILQNTAINIINGTPSANLTAGEVVTEYPYVMFRDELGPGVIKTYASKPDVVPGDWISQIQPLTGKDFIFTDPAFYVKAGTQPSHETGIYTVALVGTLHPKNPGDQPAKLIVIKHNQ